MERYAATGIKEIIAQFPRVAEILEEYSIGCGHCGIGICRLKDNLEIHSLDKIADIELMQRIEAEIYPQRNLVVAPRATTLAQAPEVSTLAVPLQTLIEEHHRARDLVKDMSAALAESDSNKLAEHLLDYATLLLEHIGKEDGVLFPWLNNRLSEAQRQELATKFSRVDKDLGNDGRRYQGFIERLEERYLRTSIE